MSVCRKQKSKEECRREYRLKKYITSWIVFMAIWGPAVQGVAATTSQTDTGNSEVVQTYLNMPLYFEINEGQAPPSARMVSHGEGYKVLLTPGEVLLALRASQTPGAMLRMQFAGANPEVQITGLDATPTTVSYFSGQDPQNWHTRIPTYAGAQYKDIYPGVDLIFRGNQRQLEYDFIVSPGGDPGAIRLVLKGTEGMELDGEGNLILHIAGGQIIQRAPVIYQEIDGRRQEVLGGFEIEGEDQVRFHVEAYDTEKPLIIDPVIVYSTYLGGDGTDVGRAITVDALGNAYLAGWTDEPDFPDGDSDDFSGDDTDVFVAKFSAGGTSLIYIAFIAGTDSEYARGIAADAAGNAYVTGWTQSEDYPVVSPYQFNHSEDTEAFVSKLNADGSTLLYSTYLGGNNFDQAYDITLDAAGNIYITGFTDSTDFPLRNPYQNSLRGGDDVFVAKFNTSGSDLLYSTYLGGDNRDFGRGIAVNAAGHIYVTGYTLSNNYPLAGPFQANNAGDEDAFVTVLNPLRGETGALLFSTYLGGSDNDEGRDIVLDASGLVYIVGETLSTNYPVINAYAPNHSGGEDVFVTKLSTTGGASALLYSTYLGSSENEEGHGITLDANGNIYITGETESSTFPVVDSIQRTHQGGGDDVFVCMLNSAQAGSASLVYSTFLGGDESDKGYGIALDSSGNVYVAGETRSDDFPTENPFQDEYSGQADAFVVKISQATAPTIPTVGGAAAGSIVQASIDTAQTDMFILLLSRQAINGDGYLYVSIEVPSVPEWAGLMWFRPSDDKIPPTLQLVKTSAGFLPDAASYFFFGGTLSTMAPDLQFIVGDIKGLAGQILVFTTWYVRAGEPFTQTNLTPIQIVRISFQ